MRKRPAFTLLELMIALGIFTTLVVLVSTFAINIFRYNRTLTDQIDAERSARVAVKQFSHEFRTITSSGLGAYPIESATATSLVFFANTNSDTSIERVRYFLNGTNLQRGVIKPTGTPLVYNSANEIVTTIVQNVTNADMFTYFDQNYTGSGSSLPFPVTITAVRLVKFRVVVNRSPGNPLENFEVVTDVAPRNLKTN